MPYKLAQHRLRPDDALPSPPNPVLEQVLPSLLFVRLASLLDEFLADYIQTNKVAVEGKQDLYHRVEALRSVLENANRLHEIRELRRRLAHETQARCSWSDLEDAVDAVDAALRQLDLVGQRPRYEIASEWDLEELDPPIVERRGIAVIEWRAIRTYMVGVKQDGTWVDKYVWQTGDTVVRAPAEGE